MLINPGIADSSAAPLSAGNRAARVAKSASLYIMVLAATWYASGWSFELVFLADHFIHPSQAPWQFFVSKMLVPLVAAAMLAAMSSVLRGGVLTGALILAIGGVSRIKAAVTGEPAYLGDLLSLGQSPALVGYLDAEAWISLACLAMAATWFITGLRLSPSRLAIVGISGVLLASYNLGWGAAFINSYGARAGLSNMPLNQAASLRYNGLATHLFFSSSALRRFDYPTEEVESALARLPDGKTVPATSGVDIYIVLAESWWLSPADPHSPLLDLANAGFLNGTATSPEYGGGTANVELELLTGLPLSSFPKGLVPFQALSGAFSQHAITIVSEAAAAGYMTRAFHNFERTFWSRHKVYPKFGFETFASLGDMGEVDRRNSWPVDTALYRTALAAISDDDRRFAFLVTVETHGPYPAGDECPEAPFAPEYCTYKSRLASAVDALIAFNDSLRAEGRDYVMLVIADHQPSLPRYQQAIGIATDAVHVPFPFRAFSAPQGLEPLFEVQIFATASGADPKSLISRIDGRPMYCLGAQLLGWAGIVADRYLRLIDASCSLSTAPSIEASDPLVHRQLFAPREAAVAGG